MRRKIVIASLVLMLLGGMGGAWASEQYQSVQVFFTKLNISLNGMPFSQQRDVMMYNGTVYVPLRSLTDMLGAQTRWTDNNTAISIDFMQDDRDLIFSAAQRGLYQYISLEKRGITQSLAKTLANQDWNGMKDVIDRIEKLRVTVLSIPDQDMAKSLEKMRTSAEWIRTSYASKKFANAKLAWVLFGQNLDQFNTSLSNRIDANNTEIKNQAAATAGDSQN